MKVKKQHLEILFSTLKGTENILSLPDSRKRDAFLKALSSELETFYKERTVIYETFCDKDENGKPDIKDDKYHFAPEKFDEINGELKTLGDEEVTIDLSITGVLEKSEYKPKIGEAEIIDKLIELCES